MKTTQNVSVNRGVHNRGIEKFVKYSSETEYRVRQFYAGDWITQFITKDFKEAKIYAQRLASLEDYDVVIICVRTNFSYLDINFD